MSRVLSKPVPEHVEVPQSGGVPTLRPTPASRILLADDDAVSRTLVEHWVTAWGYRPALARNGQEALSMLLADEDLRIVLLDWVMPKLDGLETCRAIRASLRGASTYVILLTGRDTRQDVLSALDAGADDYILKPFNPVELRIRLRAGRRIVELQQQVERARLALR